ncbi:MAG: hypothetical protein M3178_05705 [Pseudomonadota bacterium]|nr:hypothetical protein [Pseudomonadota bacterium]
MAEPQIVNTLRSKRDELERIISSYEATATAAKRDLMHVNATMELFERDGASTAYPSRMSIAHMFKRGELFALCNAALAEATKGLDTRELAPAVIRAKGMDETDAVLRKAIGFRIIQAMLRQEARGLVTGAVKRKGVRVWRQVTNSGSSDTKDNARRWNQPQ